MSGSKVVCTYPNLIAAYHVLLRLLEPRHPPFALFFLFLCEIVVVDQSWSTPFIYIVNLIAFNLLVNNKLITQFIIAFTFVNMSKIASLSA